MPSLDAASSLSRQALLSVRETCCTLTIASYPPRHARDPTSAPTCTPGCARRSASACTRWSASSRARRSRRCSAGNCCRSGCGATTTACSPKAAPSASPCWRGTARDRAVGRPAIRSRTDSLAIASDSVDAVVLPHTLEYEPEPHEILREVGRILSAEGHLIVFGFRPLSSWGLRHLFAKRRLSAGARAHDRRRAAARLAQAARLRDRRRAPLSVHVAVGLGCAVVAEFLRAQPARTCGRCSPAAI